MRSAGGHWEAAPGRQTLRPPTRLVTRAKGTSSAQRAPGWLLERPAPPAGLRTSRLRSPSSAPSPRLSLITAPVQSCPTSTGPQKPPQGTSLSAKITCRFCRCGFETGPDLCFNQKASPSVSPVGGVSFFGTRLVSHGTWPRDLPRGPTHSRGQRMHEGTRWISPVRAAGLGARARQASNSPSQVKESPQGRITRFQAVGLLRPFALSKDARRRPVHHPPGKARSLAALPEATRGA